MSKVENTHEDGGRGRGRGKMSRQSRRTRGLQPEEQKPLEVIEKEARARRAVAREEKKIPSSAQETVDLTAVDDAEASENPVVPNLVKLYVDDQVRRWEQVSLEFVMSPMMFFEVGFKFRNLVPEWFRVSTPKAEVDMMRRVTEELQHLLTVGLLEWQQVTSGVQCRVVFPLDSRNRRR
ncbi:hypothetical protein PHMEG_00028766 [Phytophthora megakarya]|uniref:Uncharacterized protein n=1 Tax=Phytophthora megakarya TaxID=4795 RepID=A0A225V545_9STRA|nr:hypothetical protein PHMEG_00028766 [Phytophthora megakarya]